MSVTSPAARLQIPIFSSPMNTVTEENMLVTMRLAGGMGVLHRYMSPAEQVAIVESVTRRLANAGLSESVSGGFEGFVAVGANGDLQERLELLGAAGVGRFCVDVANGHSAHCIEAVERIRSALPGAVIMAGNVCTYDGTMRLADAGADAIRVGIGPGSVCTTRLVTGHGVPQLTALDEAARVTRVHEVLLIVAGGTHTDPD